MLLSFKWIFFSWFIMDGEREKKWEGWVAPARQSRERNPSVPCAHEPQVASVSLLLCSSCSFQQLIELFFSNTRACF